MTDQLSELIAELHEKTDAVHVCRPDAYDAFIEGRVIFDVSPDAMLLQEFRAKNSAEFGDDIFVNDDGSFPFIGPPERRAYCTYHKHLFHKRKAQHEMRALEKEFPEIGLW